MCFSPEVDLVAGVVVGGAGVDALRHVRHRREYALAALPVVFGVHQLIEAFTWWGLDGRIPSAIGEIAMWGYLLIAFLLPALVPAAVALVERDPRRRRMVAPFVVLGVAVTVTLMVGLFTGPVTAEVAGRYIAYDVSLEYGGPVSYTHLTLPTN